MPEWLMGTDCKSVSESLRWFESSSAHFRLRSSGVERSLGKGEVMSSNLIGGSEPVEQALQFVRIPYCLIVEYNRGNQMAKKGVRIVVKMRSTESGHMYITQKSRRNTQGRLELRKYDPLLRRHVLYRETK